MNRSGLIIGAIATSVALSACSSKGDVEERRFSVSTEVVQANKMIKVPYVNGYAVPYALENKSGTSNSVDADYFLGSETSIKNSGTQLATSKLGHGLHEFQKNYNVGNYNGYSYKVRGLERIYNQPYSIVYGRTYDEVARASSAAGLQTYPHILAENVFKVHQVTGYATPSNQMPTAGTAEYKGKAFSGYDTGDLYYKVNFDTQRGSGNISGISDIGLIDLQEGRIVNTTVDGKSLKGIDAAARSGYYSGTYELGFFGPNAEEVAGRVYLNGATAGIYHNGNNRTEIGFGGSRK